MFPRCSASTPLSAVSTAKPAASSASFRRARSSASSSTTSRRTSVFPLLFPDGLAGLGVVLQVPDHAVVAHDPDYIDVPIARALQFRLRDLARMGLFRLLENLLERQDNPRLPQLLRLIATGERRAADQGAGDNGKQSHTTQFHDIFLTVTKDSKSSPSAPREQGADAML